MMVTSEWQFWAPLEKGQNCEGGEAVCGRSSCGEKKLYVGREAVMVKSLGDEEVVGGGLKVW